MTEPRKMIEVTVSCMSCGKTQMAFAHERDGRISPRARCPSCSNQAFTGTLTGLFAFMAAASDAIAKIKFDMIDLQDEPEDR